MIGRMLSAGLDTNPIIVDYSYDMPKYLKEQYLGIFVKYTGNDTDEYKNGYTYQVSQKQSGTDTVYFFAPYFHLESLASSADTSKIIDGYQAYNDNCKKIVGRYKTSEKVITENGTFYPADDSINAYSKVTVNVAGTDPGVGTGDFWVKVIDYDGTVLLEKRGNNGDSFDLPSAPSHEGLVFQEWSASQVITDNKIIIADNNVMVGAVYTTASGQNEFDITLTKATGLAVTLNMDGTKDWGDGTSDTNTTHTYTAYGDYTIKCNGTTMTTSSSSGLFGNTNSYVRFVRLVTVTTIGAYAFYKSYGLLDIIILARIEKIGNYAFCYCNALQNIIIAKGITNIGEHAFENCCSLTNLVIPNGVLSIGKSAFKNCYTLTNMVIPNGVTSLAGALFIECYALKNIIIPEGVTIIGASSFYDCYALKHINIPERVTDIGAYAFYYCKSLQSAIFSDGLTDIKGDAFNGCNSLVKLDFSQCSAVPTLSNTSAFSGITKIAKIIVPDSLYDEWIAAANWSTYANYIYKASEVTA